MSQGEVLKRFTKIIHKFCKEHEGNAEMAPFITPLNELNKEWGEITMKVGMKAMQNRDEVGGAAVDYLMYSGYVALAYFWARMAAKSQAVLAEGTSENGFYEAKLKTATFYFQRLLPRTRTHVGVMLSGVDNLMAMAEDEFQW
jgi:hypothetical protein